MDHEALPRAAQWLPAGTFDGSLALVTGGGTGLGLEISRGLAALGAEVVIASRNASHHRALLEEGQSQAWKVSAIELDVREPRAVQEAARKVEDEIGPVDLLVNNAAGNFVCPTERMSANAWRAVVGIVLDGSFFCSRYFGAGMIERRRGTILNVVATYATSGAAGVAHSASAKAGVLALSKSLAVEWAPYGIRVNAIAPGPFYSSGAAGNLWPDPDIEQRILESIPLGRFGAAEEIAHHALYLLSPAAEYVTGECLVVDGGLSLGRGPWEPGERVGRARREEA